ncbi:MAG: Translation-disabling ACNase RloC [Candidatus Carbobacillus altaicus]|uniref:Nuclease SbcCD subunit C n=1 Tax=Candidatus Carbonibacillus altaicus TaxID=2163959 RepID=A0A2R6XY05_9BACL|nr:MAG: Translation-disabling ACNase RloC [Candidatus Carbobacillus altaicus]
MGDRNFTRPKLYQRIEEIRKAPRKFIISDDDVSVQHSTLRSGEQFPEVPQVSERFTDFDLLVREVNDLLNQTASQRAIDRLKQNHHVESWVRQGLLLHKDATTCEFCGGILTTERLEELRKHFSEEYDKLVKAIENKIMNINTIALKLDIPDEMRLLPSYRQEFSQITGELSDWIQWVTGLRDGLIDKLKRKQEAIESQDLWEGNLGRANQGQQLIEALNEIIKRHNQTIASIDKEKEKVKNKLELHYAAQYFQENEIAQKEASIQHISKRIKCIEEILKRINSEIQRIEQKIKESSVGAARLNELLKCLLPDNSIKAVSMGDDKFQFHRDNRVATHLSDGEKTAVTFAYFLTSLEANDVKLSDTIVFVDDPISSLDSNHIYAVYALLIEHLKDSRQLFVSTHNSELFNLLKISWLNEKGGGRNKKNTRAYHVWRSVSTTGEPFADLRDLPTLLRKFKSEYEFVFSRLYELSIAQNPSLDTAYTAPNLLRKFLEAYLGFRKPSVSSWSAKLDLLLDSDEKRLEIQRYVNDASHLQTSDRMLQHPDYFMANAQKTVKMVLNALQEKDRAHYESLREVAKEAGG